MTQLSEPLAAGLAGMPGLMQPTPLRLHEVFERMRTVYGTTEVVGPEGRFTYAELGERVLRMCRVLTDEFGIRPGDRVASFAFNTVRHFELYWAVPLIGAVLHTVNVRLFPEQIAQIVAHAADRVVFLDGEVADRLSDTAALGVVEHWVRMAPGGDEPFAELGPAGRRHEYDELLAAAAPAAELPDVPEEAAAGLCYTSGTTGMPKGVLYSHRAMWLHAMSACMADHFALTERDTVLPVVPLFHACGWGLPYAAPFTGAALVFHGSDSSPEALARLITQERVTVSAAVPTIWKELLPLVRSGDADLSSVRAIFVGGSATPRPLAEAYAARGVDLVQVWGMTETGPLACVSKPRRHHGEVAGDALFSIKEKTGTIFSGLEARIVGEHGEALPWDGRTVGELEVRGPWIASAYYADEVGSREKFHDGWLRTGDMAWMEADGFFRIVDRAKDLVKSGGEWISSVELEGELLGHPAIRDAAVVGMPHPKWDERPVAFVVAEGNVPDLRAVHEFLADKVAKWWLPDALVVVDEIPKTSVGKIDKKVLRAEYEGRAAELLGLAAPAHEEEAAE
jgi:fatty-acyl-CoA synthase